MLDKLLPQSLDNTYRGYQLAIWLLVPVLVVKTGIAFGTIFNGRRAAQSADGIPLDTFDAGAADAVLALFAIWGLAQLVICLFGVLAITRYRAMIPLMYAVLFAEHLVRRVMLLVMPVPRTGAPPGLFINLALLGLMAVGMVLSFLGGRQPAPVGQ